MIARAPDLFPESPRRPRRVMMHVVDAGEGGWCKVIHFKCSTCGYDEGWTEDHRTIGENKRGRPCPRCNT